ncbi:MAG TPA: hypothetical protein DCL63_02340 [Firmicutes bacterium]|jgi:flagellar protein FlgJ|nr:hypothetical protein [Bacillota bacterium]HBK61326.1 hypothetical protein [Bacillota bacterium]
MVIGMWPVQVNSSRAVSSSGAVGSSVIDASRDCDPKLIQACRDFESIFIETVLKSARAGLPKDGLFSSHEQEVVRGMLDAELARAMAQGRGIGLADFIRNDVVGEGKRVKPNAAG